MFREFKNVKQEPGPGRRRWFESDHFDLVVWLEADDAIAGFQICYNVGAGEHALTWRRHSGFAHSTVDAGDTAFAHPRTPVLVPDGKVPWPEVTRLFEEHGGSLEPDLREFIRDKLRAGGRR
jgi:hypothetical protein